VTIIRLYGWRFKIEVGFKAAIHTVGTYAYHFWMRDMTPIRRGDGNQYLHRKSESYRAQSDARSLLTSATFRSGLLFKVCSNTWLFTIITPSGASLGVGLRTPIGTARPPNLVVAHALA